ncbi:MAG: hypothetical protein ACRDY4_03875 [Acidimicrobiia bacterium]
MLGLTLGRHAARVLDSRFGTAPALDVPVVTLGREVYQRVELGDLPRALLQICDAMSCFAGQPQDDSRPALRRMLTLDTPVVAAFSDVLGRYPEAERQLLG